MAEIKEAEKALASWANQKFKDAMMAKETKTAEWMEYLNAWNNSLYEDQSVPSYRSNQSSNFIYSTIESMRPIMFDGHPKFEAVPVTAEAMEYAQDINQVLDYEWHRTGMQKIMLANSIYTLVTGTSIIMLHYEIGKMPNDDVDGNVKPIAVNPFNLFPDPLATSVEDAEYIIYATYKHKNILKQLYSEKADAIIGADIQYSELVNNRNEGASIKDQVLVLEVWTRDYTTIDAEEEDGTTKKTSKYPLGRVITIAPDLGIVLEDKPNPYQTGRFPFFVFKDIEVPFQFWGEGEVKWLLSPQQAINDLSNQIIDNAKHTANMQWVIDKNAGIPQGQLTNRPGLVIRKNPGTEVRRDSPPSMPMYVSEKINSLKADIEVISGVHDVTRGQQPGGIESGSAIMALQEAAQTRIRLKIQLHEYYLGEFGTEWLERIKQFWKFNRLIPIKKASSTDPNAQGMTGVAPEQAPFDFVQISQDKQLAQNYRVKVTGTSQGNMNNNAWLDLMIRLAQTTADDGMPMVTREAVLDFLPKVNKERILKHFAVKQQQQMMMQQQQMASQNAMQGTQEILGQMNQQMMGMNDELGKVQGRFAQEDQKKAEEDLKAQGYDMGMKEGMALQQQGAGGELPPELMDQMANMSEEELAQFLQENPDIAASL